MGYGLCDTDPRRKLVMNLQIYKEHLRLMVKENKKFEIEHLIQGDSDYIIKLI